MIAGGDQGFIECWIDSGIGILDKAIRQEIHLSVL
jgi:hypothetical protein